MKDKTLYVNVGGDDQLYILTPEDMEKYLKIYDAVRGNKITWNEYKKLLDDEECFNSIYNEWLKRWNFGENFSDLVKKIQKGIDISNEDNFEELKNVPIHFDELMPDLLFDDLPCSLGNDPGEYLYSSLPQDIVDAYYIEGTCGGPGCSSGLLYLDYELKDEIIKELESRGYTVVEVNMLPF